MNEKIKWCKDRTCKYWDIGKCEKGECIFEFKTKIHDKNKWELKINELLSSHPHELSHNPGGVGVYFTEFKKHHQLLCGQENISEESYLRLKNFLQATNDAPQ